MTRTRMYLILSAGLFVFANTLSAQSRTCRWVFPERPNDAPKVAYLFDGTKSHSISLPSMNLSEVMELPAGEITLAMTRGIIDSPELLPRQAPSLKIPEGIRDFYIILVPDPKNSELPLKMNLVDTGGGKLKPGETLWYNFTGHRIAAKLGTAQMSIEPAGRAISRNPVPNSGYYVARFAYQANGEGEFAPITEQSWWHDANSRHLGFMVNTGGKLPKIYFYRDYRLSESAEG